MKRIINYIRQWMALRKREEAVSELERELQDRMTCIDEKMALREVTDVYAKYVCMMHIWPTSATAACGAAASRGNMLY